jgi:hypothetical protein
MAFTPYHNILGATARDNELVAVGDILRKGIKAIQITNIDASAAGTVSLYLYKDSTDTTTDETIYILHDVEIPYAVSLLLDNPSILGFDNSSYGLHMEVGASDEIDVILST